MAKTTKTDHVAAMIARGAAPPPAPAETVRDIGTITAEIVTLKGRAGECLVEIGKRLIEAKEILPHGEWLPWLETEVDFSERTAQNLMKIAREWANPQALADLTATKVIRLLSLPEAEREEFIAAPHSVNGAEKTVQEMSTRELEQAIKERDAARKEAEAEKKRADGLAYQLDTSRAAGRELEKDKKAAETELQATKTELEALRKKPVDVAVETVRDEKAIEEAVERAKSETRAAVETALGARLKQAEAQAAKADGLAKDAAKAQTALDVAKQEIEDLKRQVSAANDAAKNAENLLKESTKKADLPEDAILYKILFEQIVSAGNQLAGIRQKAKASGDTQMADGVGKALLALAERFKGAATA